MTVAGRYENARDHIILWAVVVSLLLHGALLAPWLGHIVDKLEMMEAKAEPVVPPLEFTLVSPPNEPSPTDQLSNMLSTAAAQARQEREAQSEQDLPLNEGTIPIPDNPGAQGGTEGGGQSEIPPLPEETADLGKAIEKARITETQSPQRQESLPMEAPDFHGEGSARASVGNIQLNTTAWDFAPYLLDLKYRIKNHWIPPLAFTALGAIHGYTVLRFRIYPDGSMEDLEVLETEGHESLHRSSSNAVRGAAPFRKLPADFPEDYLEITFGFYYMLPGDEQRFFKNRGRSSD